jgi:carbamoyltransferase
MPRDTFILGINAYHADASAALLRNGEIVAAAEEERFNRIKHSAGFPSLAVRFCLERARIAGRDLDHVGISRVPTAHPINKLTFVLHNRLMFSHQGLDRLRSAEKIFNIHSVVSEALGVPESDLRAEFHNVEHHMAHMASSFYASGFDEAAVLSIDGFGDFCSTMLGHGTGTQIEKLGSVLFPHSLGLFYTAITQYLGFEKYGDEGKVMGLAPYGEPRYLDRMMEIVTGTEEGGFELNLEYFTHQTGGIEMGWDLETPHVGRVYSDRMVEAFGPARRPDAEITRHHRDVAASLQKCLENHLFRLLRRLHEKTRCDNLCMAGGVAYNSVANGQILRHSPFREVFIQPAAGDSGTALGVALHIWHSLLGNPRGASMESAYLGPDYTDAEIERALQAFGASYERCSDTAGRAAELLAAGKIVGWFQGRMEFGPRALGNRSILADPRQREIKDVLNRRIKHRESFRPFAPAVLEEHVAEYFEDPYPSPFMLMVFTMKPGRRETVPATEHVDHTGRVQSVSRNTNPRFWELIEEFRKRTGIPMVLNTSFNENEPIVCTPDDALHCFGTTTMDALVLGDYLVTR